MILIIQIISDIISFILANAISFYFYNIGYKDALADVSFVVILCGLSIFILSIYNFNGYKLKVEFSKLAEITSLVNAAISTLILYIIIFFIFKISIPEYVTTLSSLIFAFILLILPSFLRIIIKNLIPHKITKDNIIIIGFGEIGKSFIETQQHAKLDRFNIVGIFDDSKKLKNMNSSTKFFGNLNNIPNFLKKEKVNRIIVAIRKLDEEKIKYIELIASQNQIPLNFLPSIESFKNNPGKLKEHAGIPFISKNIEQLPVYYLAGKRLIDIITSILSILISLPVWIIIPILIKKDSKGPVIFRQKRIGLNGKVFHLYKFRSMYTDSPKYAHCPTNSSDKRITPIGRWLRKTSIDELPQLLNVLKGEMSMVGPRPEMPFIVERYNTIERRRLIRKPGLTGLWQVSRYRNSEISLNLEYDFYYIENQGFVLDFVILLMTVFFAIRGITN